MLATACIKFVRADTGREMSSRRAVCEQEDPTAEQGCPNGVGPHKDQ